MSVRTFTLNDDPDQVVQDLNTAFDGTTQTDLKAKSLSGGSVSATTISASGQITSTVAPGTPPLVVASNTEVTNLRAATATNSVNVTSNINGHAISDIFESDGITAKTATTIKAMTPSDTAIVSKLPEQNIWASSGYVLAATIVVPQSGQYRLKFQSKKDPNTIGANVRVYLDKYVITTTMTLLDTSYGITNSYVDYAFDLPSVPANAILKLYFACNNVDYIHVRNIYLCGTPQQITASMT
jgi:hypothetical protein